MNRATPFALLLPLAALAQQAPTPRIATDVLVVRGRCVDFESGAPLARCRVQLTGHASTGYSLAWSRTDWFDPPEITTGPDGTFRFELRLSATDEAFDRGRYHVTIEHPSNVGWFSHCTFFVAAARGGIDYGDVRLPKGVRPRIRCVDRQGVPQPGVLLYLRARPREAAGDDPFVQVVEDGPHSWIERSAYQRTDIDGYLHLQGGLPAGDYVLEVRQRKAKQATVPVTLPTGDPIVVEVDALDPAATITGRLVDEAGQPVDGASISDGDDGKNACATRRDGMFTLVRVEDTGRATANLRLAQNRRFDGWAPLGEVEWGRRDVALTVPTKSLHTFVVRSEDGTEVEEFNLYCLPAPDDVRTGVRLSGTFANGRALSRLPAGEYRLLVAPRSDLLVDTGWQTIDVEDGRAEIQVVVPRSVARTVEVVWATGRAPVPGVLVEAVTGPAPSTHGFVRPDSDAELPTGARRDDRPLLVAAARTDARGLATLRLREAGPVHLRISGAGVCNAVVEADLTRDEPLPIVAQPGAMVAGGIGPLEALRLLHPGRDDEKRPTIYAWLLSWPTTVSLVRQGGDGAFVCSDIHLDTRGRFRVEGLPPGKFAIHVRHWRRVGENGFQQVERPIVVGTCTLEAGAAQELDLRLPIEESR